MARRKKLVTCSHSASGRKQYPEKFILDIFPSIDANNDMVSNQKNMTKFEY